jgi:hypothetical protein
VVPACFVPGLPIGTWPQTLRRPKTGLERADSRPETSWGIEPYKKTNESLPSGPTSMKRSEREAVGYSLVLLAVILAAAVFYFSGWATIVKNVAVLAWRGNAMVNLAKRTPFTPRSDAGVSDERLKAYLEVCGRIKPFGDKIDEWEARHSGSVPHGAPSFKGAGAGLVEDYLREFGSALEDQLMGPTEFAWIGERMRLAADGAPAMDTASESDRVLYRKYRTSLEVTTLGTHALQIARDFAR